MSSVRVCLVRVFLYAYKNGGFVVIGKRTGYLGSLVK